MLKNILVVVLVLGSAAVHLHDASSLKAGNVTLTDDSGQFLKICHNCGNAVPDSASIQAVADGTQVWKLELVGSKVAFKGTNGLYLTRCNGCWRGSRFPDSATVHVAAPAGNALWKPELQSNGKYAFKGDTGKYLARCSNCTSSPASQKFAFVHISDPNNAGAQWTVTYVVPKVTLPKGRNGQAHR